MLGICVIWIIISALNDVNAMLRKDLNTSTILRGDMDHCKRSKEDRYSCWIGQPILSRDGEFYKILSATATSNKLIILSFVDFSYLDLAVNLHESFKALHISNFLFICADEKSLKVLQRRSIASFLYQHPQINSDESPKFHSDDFKLKASIKIKIITAALMLGFQVLFTDADVVFLRDPLPYLTSYKGIDLVIQNDTDSGLNSGFLLAHPTYSSVTLMHRALDIVMTRIIFDQVALNLVINEMVSTNSLDIVVLDPKRFPNGKVYFEDEKRMFLEDRSQHDVAFIVHNNFLHTKVAITTESYYEQ